MQIGDAQSERGGLIPASGNIGYREGRHQGTANLVFWFSQFVAVERHLCCAARAQTSAKQHKLFC